MIEVRNGNFGGKEKYTAMDVYKFQKQNTHTQKKNESLRCVSNRFQKIVRNEKFGGKEKYTAQDVCRFQKQNTHTKNESLRCISNRFQKLVCLWPNFSLRQ